VGPNSGQGQEGQDGAVAWTKRTCSPTPAKAPKPHTVVAVHRRPRRLPREPTRERQGSVQRANQKRGTAKDWLNGKGQQHAPGGSGGSTCRCPAARNSDPQSRQTRTRACNASTRGPSDRKRRWEDKRTQTKLPPRRSGRQRHRAGRQRHGGPFDEVPGRADRARHPLVANQRQKPHSCSAKPENRDATRRREPPPARATRRASLRSSASDGSPGLSARPKNAVDGLASRADGKVAKKNSFRSRRKRKWRAEVVAPRPTAVATAPAKAKAESPRARRDRKKRVSQRERKGVGRQPGCGRRQLHRWTVQDGNGPAKKSTY